VGTLVSIIYTDKKLRLLMGEEAIPVALGDIDTTHKTVNLNVTLRNGKPGVWTLRQLWDPGQKSFHLQFTLHDGTQDALTFVRTISSDDLHRIANAEARSRPGAISAAVTPGGAPATTESFASTPQPAPAVLPVPVQAPSPVPVIQQPEPPPKPVYMPWAPSFDCAKVSTGSERLICSTKELAEADVQMAQVYKVALRSASDKDALKRAQNAWRQQERDACADTACMMKAYQQRITQLARESR
jgi:hypothetical protein